MLLRGAVGACDPWDKQEVGTREVNEGSILRWKRGSKGFICLILSQLIYLETMFDFHSPLILRQYLIRSIFRLISKKKSNYCNLDGFIFHFHI